MNDMKMRFGHGDYIACLLHWVSALYKFVLSIADHGKYWFCCINNTR